jgi:hypothetical protein
VPRALREARRVDQTAPRPRNDTTEPVAIRAETHALLPKAIV